MAVLPEPDVRPVGEHLEWMRATKLAQSTIEARLCVLILLARWLQDRPEPKTLVGAEPQDLAAWQRSIHWMAAESISTYVGHVIGFYRWRQKFHEAPDGARLLVRPRLPKRMPRPIPDDALRLALTTATPRIRVCLLLMAFCGLRVGEVAHLTRRDLRDSSDPPVVIVTGKGGKVRVVPVPPVVVAELRAAGLPLAGPLVTTNSGRPYSPNRLSQVVNEHLHELGITDTAHTLRHWYGTKSFRVTHDIMLVGQMLGHESPSATAGYVAYDPAGMGPLMNDLNYTAAAMLRSSKPMPAPLPRPYPQPDRRDVAAAESRPRPLAIRRNTT